jgi:hypothetical protein
VFSLLSDRGRALVVGHIPTNEAAVYGLTGVIIEPMGKGAGALIIEDGETVSVRPIG